MLESHMKNRVVKYKKRCQKQKKTAYSVRLLPDFGQTKIKDFKIYCFLQWI